MEKAKEFESAAIESAVTTQLEREGTREALRRQQEVVEDTLQVGGWAWGWDIIMPRSFALPCIPCIGIRLPLHFLTPLYY